MKTPPPLRTPQQAAEWFRANGISVSQWCREHGIARHTVVDLLRGRQRGLRGESHRAAVAMRLKPNPQQTANYHIGGDV